MKTLLLLRHAKSSWDHPDLDDFDRPLNERGRTAAPRMGRWIRDEGWIPDRVLCSAARRARETWKAVARELGEEAGVEVEVSRDLYLASPGRILSLVAEQPDSAGSLLLVGHNPGFEDLARRLAGEGPYPDRMVLAERFPTAALAILRFPVSRWEEVAPGAGSLVRFVRPADLEA